MFLIIICIRHWFHHRQKKNKNIYLLFAIVENKIPNYYAIKQVNNTLTLLQRNNNNKQEYGKAVANDPSLKIEIYPFGKYLKYDKENLTKFIERVADIKTNEFINNLVNYFNEPTVGEKVIDFLKSLIPFYTCVQSININNQVQAGFSCTLDALSIVSMAGVASKSSNIFLNNIIARIQTQSFWSVSGQIVKLPLTTLISRIYKSAIQIVAEKCLIKGFLKDLSITFLQILDPGFELAYKLSKFSYQLLRKLFHSSQLSAKFIPEVKNLLLSMKSDIKIGNNKNLLPDHTGLIPKVIYQKDNYKVIKYIYPGGENYFGPNCISSFGNTAELRTIEGNPFQVPVVPIKDDLNKISYREYNPTTNKISDDKLEMERNDILRRVIPYLNLDVDVKITRNYIVNHLSVHWKKNLKNNWEEGNLNPFNEVVNVNQPGDNLEKGILNPSDEAVNFNQHDDKNPIVSSDVSENVIPTVVEDYKSVMKDTKRLKSTADEIDLDIPEKRKKKVSIPVVEAINNHDLDNIPGTLNQVVAKNNLEKGNLNPSDEADNFNQHDDKNPIVSSDVSENVIPTVVEDYKSVMKDTKRLKSTADEIDLDNIPGTSKQTVANNNLEEGNLNPSDEAVNFNQHDDKNPIVSSDVSENVIPKVVEDSKSVMKDTESLKTTADEIDLDNIPGTSKQIAVNRNLISYNFFNVFTAFKELGIYYIKLNEVLNKKFRLDLTNLALEQMKTPFLNFPLKEKEFWTKQIITQPVIIKKFEIMKGEEFFFNDITYLSDKVPVPSNNLFQHSKEVWFHVIFDSEYGVVDVSQLDKKLQHSYITFSDVFFKITNTYYNKNNILTIDMKSQTIEKNIWKNQRLNDLEELNKIESNYLPRMKIIEKAVNIMVEKIPMCTDLIAKTILKNYILRLKSISSSVPTYKKFAQDFSKLKTAEINSYSIYKFKNAKYIDDLLFEKNLDKIKDANEARHRINVIYNHVYEQPVDIVFDNYKKLINYRRYLRFEDYYAFYSHWHYTLTFNLDNNRRFLAAIYRIAIRQCNENWIKEPIKIYLAISSVELNQIHASSKINDYIKFDQIKLFSSNREIQSFDTNSGSNPSSQKLMYEIEIRNQAGIMNMNRIFEDININYIVLPELKFVLVDKRYENDMLILKMHDIENPTESRMVDMINTLNLLYETETQFYLTENET
ncbi:uncharacterized protein LOC127290950 isoform X2 [Leptopilina boulardi]|uniref:uncharacterized protein LOC127290950 isoform X2 n=1 Tax=Leptopilina boulardi TaxID=63433 RepID=UPI0021F66096|nr:uncharacterized protein LOC127290950 isoform X2 [Leptopilina boulardi]